MKTFRTASVLSLLLLALCNAPGQVNQLKYPRIAIQQTWVETRQHCIVDIVSRFDLLQVDLDPEQISAVRARNPDAIILPFDSMGEPRVSLPEVWATDGTLPSKDRDIQNVTDDCPRFFGEGSFRGVAFDGRNFQEWKAEQLATWRDRGYDGVYVDLWHNDLDWLNVTTMDPEAYKAGMTHLADRLRALWPDAVLMANSGSEITHSFALNGFMYEDFPAYTWPVDKLLGGIGRWTGQAAGPQRIIINQRSLGVDQAEERDNQSGGIKADFWERMRYTVTLSMLWDVTYAMFNYGSGGSPHWANPWFFDEFETDVGLPVGPARELAPRVLFREFTAGAVICNVSGEPVTVSAAQLSGGPYYRFRGAQRPDFNDGGSFDQVVLDGWGVRGDKQKPMGDGIILVKAPQTAVADVVIDDGGYDPGEWGTDLGPANNIGGRFSQVNFLYDRLKYKVWKDAWRIHGHNTCYYSQPGDASAQAVWTPEIGHAGRYEVFEWHPVDNTLTSQARYAVTRPGTRAEVIIDQSRNGGQWNSLGVFDFPAGRSNQITLTNAGSRVLVADAIKLVFRGSSGGDSTPPNSPDGVRVHP